MTRIEVRVWVDGVELDLSPRVARLLEQMSSGDSEFRASWRERVRDAVAALRGE